MDNDDNEISNDDRYGNDYGALLVETAAPDRGSFTLLIPENFTWGARRRNGAIRITFREVAKTRAGRVDAEEQEGVD